MYRNGADRNIDNLFKGTGRERTKEEGAIGYYTETEKVKGERSERKERRCREV
jgi:hypothetical protein